jgi:hypothetical protein
MTIVNLWECRQSAGVSAIGWDDVPRLPSSCFGPMSGGRWHVLAVVTLGLHRRQIEAILLGLAYGCLPRRL